MCWGLGHATTLFLFGLPVILFRRFLPPAIKTAAEVMVGALIVALAIRLLVRWRRGSFHIHTHAHGEVLHAHPHVHEGVAHPAQHRHQHADRRGRSPLAAFGIGMLHGAGGSAAVGVLLISAVPGRARGVVALVLFARGRGLDGRVSPRWLCLARGRRSRQRWVPVFAPAVLFGVWYALDALGSLPKF